MDRICRLCLTVPSQLVYILHEECEVLSKIRTCLSIQITLNDSFPNQVCCICINKVEDIYEFHQKITQNDHKLIHQIALGKNFLELFYEDIKKSRTEIKEEKEDTELDDSETRLDAIPDLNCKQNNSSSEDEITLSKIQVDKKRAKSAKIRKKTKTKLSSDKITLHQKDNTKSTYKKTKLLSQNLENIALNCLTCFQKFESQMELINHYHNEHNTLANIENDPNIKIKDVNDSIENTNRSIAIGNYKGNDVNHESDDQNKNNDENYENSDDQIPRDCPKTEIDNIKTENSTKYVRKSLEDGSTVYECCRCMKRYNKKKDITRHVSTHASDRPFLCKLCGRTYKTVYEIIRHGRAHNGLKLHCSHKCGFSTAYTGALKEHERRHGTPEYKYTCEECGKGFQAKTWYEQHRNIHSGLKPFICEICGLSFHMDRYLTAHRSTVHPQTSKVKRYVCVHCLLPCDTRNSLKRHMEEHGVKTTFLCDLCGKVFTNAELLKYHKNGHLGVKPYSCSVCNKTFAKKFNLKIHELTHTGVRSHVCVKCGKYFTQRSTLLRHNRRHHQELQLKDEANIVANVQNV